MKPIIRIYWEPAGRPDMFEGIPERVKADKPLLAAKREVFSWLPGIIGNQPILCVGPAAGGFEMDELVAKYIGNLVVGTTLYEEEKEELLHRGHVAFVQDMHRMEGDPEGPFSLIYASHVLEHSAAPLIALREMFRAAAPGAWLCIVMPEPAGMLHPGNAERAHRFDTKEQHIFCASVETMVFLLRKAGWRFESYHEAIVDALQGKAFHIYRVWIAREGSERA